MLSILLKSRFLLQIWRDARFSVVPEKRCRILFNELSTMLKDAEEFARAAAAEPAAAPAELQTEIGAQMERAEAAEPQPDVAGVEAAGGAAAGLL